MTRLDVGSDVARAAYGAQARHAERSLSVLTRTNTYVARGALVAAVLAGLLTVLPHLPLGLDRDAQVALMGFVVGVNAATLIGVCAVFAAMRRNVRLLAEQLRRP